MGQGFQRLRRKNNIHLEEGWIIGGGGQEGQAKFSMLSVDMHNYQQYAQVTHKTMGETDVFVLHLVV